MERLKSEWPWVCGVVGAGGVCSAVRGFLYLPGIYEGELPAGIDKLASMIAVWAAVWMVGGAALLIAAVRQLKGRLGIGMFWAGCMLHLTVLVAWVVAYAFGSWESGGRGWLALANYIQVASWLVGMMIGIVILRRLLFKPVGGKP